MMRCSSQNLTVQGLSLRLWDFGGTGPVVLCLHGYLDNGRSFEWLAMELAGTARLLSLDWRGHGQSDWVGPGGSYHLLDHVKDLHLVVEALERAGTTLDMLVGHSMGGNIALLWAGACPGRVPRLLLLDSLGPPAEDAAAQPERLEMLLRNLSDRTYESSRVENVADAKRRLLLSNPHLSARGAERMAKYALVPHPNSPSHFCFAFDPRVRGPTPHRWPEEMWRQICARLKCAVTLLRAEHGYVSALAGVRDRLARIADVKEEVAEGSGHHLHVDAPDQVAACIRRLLLRPAGSPSALP